MRSLQILFLVILCAAFVSGCSAVRKETAHQHLLSLSDHSLIPLTLKAGLIEVEVVNTAQTTQQGLSGRDQIGSDGLLFVFNQKSYQQFWMKKMKFDLDIIWLEDLRVVDITSNVPHPHLPADSLRIYSPKVPVNGVLEVPGGTVQRWQLKIGDTFDYSW